jgi:hypothetical protein
MERRATNQRRISLPTRLAICVAKQATELRSVQREAPKMMMICMSQVAAQKEAPRSVLLNSRRKEKAIGKRNLVCKRDIRKTSKA